MEPALPTGIVWEMLRERGFREALQAAYLMRVLALQIRTIRHSRGWTQQELAKRAGLSVLTVNRMERTCEGATLTSLKALAKAFDCALTVRFTSWGTFIFGGPTSLSTAALDVPSYEQEAGSPRVREGRDQS